jgi:hypothetical protein
MIPVLEALLCILQNREAFVMGTSFGFDVTRAEYIGIGKGKIMLRISVGIELEPEIYNVRDASLEVLKRNYEYW